MDLQPKLRGRIRLAWWSYAARGHICELRMYYKHVGIQVHQLIAVFLHASRKPALNNGW